MKKKIGNEKRTKNQKKKKEMFGSLRAAFEDVVDSGIGLLAQVPGLADAAESAREALTPFRSSLSENGWPKGHRVEIAGKIFVIESLVKLFFFSIETMS